jgi:hypothetical protein
MTIETVTKPDVTYTEAPASWNVSYITPEGYVCRITLRGESGKDLLDKASVALTFLMQHGCTPEHKFSRNNKDGETRQCPIHKCMMRRYEKDGKSWFSHKADDGSYCYGKNKQEAHYV